MNINMLKEKDQMLVKVRVGFFRGKKTSHKLAEEAAAKHHAAEDRILVRLSLMNPEDAGKLLNVAKRARRLIRDNTMPYDGIWRRTTTAIYPKLVKEMNALERLARDTAQDLANRWDSIKKEAMRKLPGLVDDTDFPASGEEFLGMFSFQFAVNKVVNADDLKFSLPEADMEKIREQVREEEKEKMAEGRKWLADWAADFVKSVKSSLTSGTVRKGTSRKLDECAKFIEDNSIGQVPAAVTRIRELSKSLGSEEKPSKENIKQADSVLDELANFGK